MATFSKKHYIRLADVFLTSKPHRSKLYEVLQWQRDLDTLAAMFEQDNPAFDKSKFFDAAGFKGGV